MWILAQILTEITQAPRYRVRPGVDFEWSKKSWTHNIFRVYELIFWRRYGIRAEITSYLRDGRSYHIARSWEGTFALFETYIRSLFSFRVPFKIWIPILYTPEGIPVPQSPYLFAIAFDAVTHSYTQASSTSASLSHTATGSNLLAWCHVNTHQVGSAAVTPVNYNGVGMTGLSAENPARDGFAPNDVSSWMFWLQNPSTGAQTINVTCASANSMDVDCCTYTGCSQSSIPDAHSKTENTSATTSCVLTVTTVADQCWLVGCFRNEIGGQAAGANTTIRYDNGDGGIADSNAARSTGSNSISTTFGSAVNAGIVASFAPVGGGGATTVHLPYLNLLGVGQ